MEPVLASLIFLPISLGLLGFIEPCTIGSHLLFLNTQESRSRAGQLKAVIVFIAARTLVTGMLGALIAYVGQTLFGLQNIFGWVFGILFIIIGVDFLVNRPGRMWRAVGLSPEKWKKAQSPLFLGMVFGLNIPATGIPVLLVLLSLAANIESAVQGLWMMALFGFFLSAPLLLFVASPALHKTINTLSQKLKTMRRFVGVVFLLIGAATIYLDLL